MFYSRLFSHSDHNLADSPSAPPPIKRITWILSRTRKIDSDILFIPFRNFLGVRKCEIWPRCSTAVASDTLRFRNEVIDLKCESQVLNDNNWPMIFSNFIYTVSQKRSFLKLFAIFSLRLSIFPWNFAALLPVMLTNFGGFILIFNKMALIFLGVLIIFYRFKFRVSTSQIALTLSLMMSGSNSPDLNPLDYQVWAQCWNLNKSCNKSQNQFPSFKMHLS